MTTVSIAICAHISRKEMAHDLAIQLDAPISMDEGERGSVANHNATLRLAAESAADWVMVMEDDAEPIPEFREQAAAALAVCPGPFASLYFGYVGAPDARIAAELAHKNPHWVMRQGLSSAVCLAIRADHIDPFFAQIEQVTEDLPADHLYAEAAFALGHRWNPHSHPSLVNHRDSGSLIAGDPPNFHRRAYRVGRRAQWLDRTI